MQKTVYGRRSAYARLRLLNLRLLMVRPLIRKLQPPGSKSFMLAMKLTIVLLTAALLQVHATAVSQSVTISGKDLPLKKVFSLIEKQTGFVVLSNKKDMDATKPVTLSVFDIPLQELLTMILRDQPVNYRLDGTTIVLSRKPVTEPNLSVNIGVAAGISVDGNVTDSLGRPVSDASVRLIPGNKGTSTNQYGGFSIPNVEAGNYTLEVSFVGYETHRRQVTVPKYGVLQVGRILLKAAKNDLTTVEVLATGYQTLPRERSTGSFTTVSHDVLSTRVEPNILTRLEGLVPGLYMNSGNVNIRGLATLYGNKAPLYVVDGFPYEGDLSYLNPDDILNITVMKDAAAASIYGTRAANGVISITTRLGSARQTRINYNSTLFINPIPDASYLNLLNSSEMVDLQRDLFNKYHSPYNPSQLRYAQPKAIEALYAFEAGDLTQAQLDATLNTLRSRNGQAQVEDLLMQSSITHKHSLSITGGNNVNQYGINLNYIGDRGYDKKAKDNIINLGLNDKAQIFKWLSGELGLFSNFTNFTSSPVSGLGQYRNMPYEAIKDEHGNNITWNFLKSASEIKRLTDLGLLDESYNPLNELDRSDIRGNSQYIRVQGGFNVKITKALNLDLKYQTERGSSYYKNYNSFESWRAANMINNATTIDQGTIIKNIPDGGMIQEIRGDSRSYTARAQLNFDKRFGSDHQVTALAGAERRAVVTSSTSVHRMGFNDNSVLTRPIDYEKISNLPKTESIEGNYQYPYDLLNYFRFSEERFVSFYGNVGYNFKGRYNLTGSVRIDDSNLFGTDPKYRHLPLWSAGANWRISEEDFMSHVNWLNNLNVRATYGMGGNIARETGPFLQASSRYFSETQAISTNIEYPPNKELRWEKTVTTNFGVDFGFLRNRINVSFDYYQRKTTDLLGEKKTDPTNAFPVALINYGSLINKGFEIAINTVNIDKDGFKWNTRFTLGHNKNKMTDISLRSESLYSYVDGYGVNRVGYPMNSIFNFRSAGLDPTNGTPLVYDRDGKVVKNYDATGAIVANMNDKDALVFGGTLTPTYTIGLMNTFSYKHFTLTVMIVANGGNVFRDAIPGPVNTSNFSRNQDRRILNYWKKPGDENLPDVQPATDLKNNGGVYLNYIWYSTDRNTLKADFVKVRNIGLSYDFASHLSGLAKLSSASLLFQVQNPFKWLRNDKGLDPEAYSVNSIGAERALPVMPTYMMGINVTL